MQTDIEHFRNKLGKISGAGNLGDQLLGLVNAKTIASGESEESESASEKPGEGSKSPESS